MKRSKIWPRAICAALALGAIAGTSPLVFAEIEPGVRTEIFLLLDQLNLEVFALKATIKTDLTDPLLQARSALIRALGLLSVNPPGVAPASQAIASAVAFVASADIAGVAALKATAEQTAQGILSRYALAVDQGQASGVDFLTVADAQLRALNDSLIAMNEQLADAERFRAEVNAGLAQAMAYLTSMNARRAAVAVKTAQRNLARMIRVERRIFQLTKEFNRASSAVTRLFLFGALPMARRGTPQGPVYGLNARLGFAKSSLPNGVYLILDQTGRVQKFVILR